MVEKSFTTAFGKASSTLESQDTLLSEKISDRERNRIDREEEKDDAKHDAEMAELKKKKTTADASSEKAGEARQESSGYKVTGEMNLGTINLQEEREVAKAAAEREREDSKKEAERLRKELAESAGKTADENRLLRADLHAAEIREIKAAAGEPQGSLTDQILMVKTLASELGLKPPDAAVGDSSVQLQILAMTHAEAQRDREFKWQMEQDRNAREDRREDAANNLAMRGAELAQGRERTELIVSAVKTVGATAAAGLMASEGAEPASSPPQGVKVGNIQVGIGGSGETKCIKCKQPVAVGPTAKSAVCAGCGARYSIQRTQAASPGEQKDE